MLITASGRPGRVRKAEAAVAPEVELQDPGVVRAGAYVLEVGCPADAADLPGELTLTCAPTVPFGRAGARAIDRHDGWSAGHDQVSDLLAVQPAPHRQHPALINDGGVEALPRAANINADPPGHKS